MAGTATFKPATSRDSVDSAEFKDCNNTENMQAASNPPPPA